MIQFNCNGHFLDITEGFSPSLKRKNNAFAFGSLELGRSLAFDVPATPNNNTIFQQAKDYHKDGHMARVQIQTQMQYGGGVCNGILYISKTNAKTYSCVFVFGELYALKALSDAGKIQGGFGDKTKILPREPANGTYAMDRWASIDYMNGNRYGLPSVNLSRLFDDVPTLYGVNVFFTQEMQRVRDIIGELNAPQFSTNFAKILPYFEITNFNGHGILEGKTLTRSDELKHAIINGVDTIQGQTQGGKDDFYAQDFALAVGVDSISIKFGNDFPDNIFICRYRSVNDVTFYGDRSFNTALGHDGVVASIVGRPLAGREISIDRVDSDGNLNYFSFYDINTWYRDGVGMAYNAGFIKFDNCTGATEEGELVFNFPISIESKTKGDISEDIEYRLNDNLPDLTYIDILELFCNLYGKRIVANGNNISFTDLNVSQWRIYDFTELISEGDTERKFLDWAQNNTIQFDSDESVFSGMRIKQEYTINNVNIDKNNDIYTVPFSEGNSAFVGNVEVANVRDLQTYRDEQGEEITEIIADKPTIASCGSVEQMERINLSRVQDVQSLCDASTKIMASFVCSLSAFVSLPEDCRIWHNGALWVWTDATFLKGTINITLQKI